MSHRDLIQKGIEPRVDIYKVVFLLTQMCIMLFLIFALKIKNRTIKKQFAQKVKLEVSRLINDQNPSDTNAITDKSDVKDDNP